jgi:hypothetical protein
MKLINLLLLLFMATSVFAADEIVPELSDTALPFVEAGDAAPAVEFSDDELPFVEELADDTPEVLPFAEENLPFIEGPEVNIAPLEDTTQIVEDKGTTLVDEKLKQPVTSVISSISPIMFILYSLGFLLIIGIIIYFAKKE